MKITDVQRDLLTRIENKPNYLDGRTSKALLKRGLVKKGNYYDYEITEAGREALAAPVRTESGRPRLHADQAQKQQAYRWRKEKEAEDAARIIAAAKKLYRAQHGSHPETAQEVALFLDQLQAIAPIPIQYTAPEPPEEWREL